MQRRAQVLADLATDVAGVRHDGIQRAMFLQPLYRGLGADLGYTGNIVRGIADEGQVFDNALRRYTELVYHSLTVVACIFHGVDQGDVVVDQLRHVLVAGGNHGAHASGSGLGGQGADHVIRLHPRNHK